jgi:DNA primase catalytic subunit
MGNQQQQQQNLYQEYFRARDSQEFAELKQSVSQERRVLSRPVPQSFEYFRHQSFNNLRIATQEAP